MLRIAVHGGSADAAGKEEQKCNLHGSPEHYHQIKAAMAPVVPQQDGAQGEHRQHEHGKRTGQAAQQGDRQLQSAQGLVPGGTDIKDQRHTRPPLRVGQGEEGLGRAGLQGNQGYGQQGCGMGQPQAAQALIDDRD